MAIARGAGTETLRSVFLENVSNTQRTGLIGEQHHVYTVLSIIVNAQIVAAAGNHMRCHLQGYDANHGTTNRPMYIFYADMNQYETFVFNDKFSFNGHEPTDFASGDVDVTKQNAIADQASSVAQYLSFVTEGADNMDVLISYIDQNNS